ncbi:CDP-glycerol glycerophosphotransferase family protein [Komagataeibacter nataicola]|uniref:CDP-glycerol glycerophosphotransferase family protein n=1 Tax=Komagataeibacter nataicola TaxID=265960 RepID=UPI0023DD5DCF|nr:CDP-glycerol glycerophosphotransferase family protein [Komagataeibacter nataicola]WEQ55261.1 CDP-glycerol glycerophosphotransferase family protein [Komagataeibacter nataicola]WNM09858.1 CDP-glycerol glycerophosphotransferase family protein [Komagataeibacter nataicola]
MTVKIAFVYIAEPYQCYHAASVASALSALPDCSVTEYYSFSDSAEHLRHIRTLFGGNDSLSIRPFQKSVFTKILHIGRRLDREKSHVFRENIEELNNYDAIISTENTAAFLKQQGLKKPKLILIQHGAGDRKVRNEYMVKYFDFVLFPGPKIRNYFLKEGFTTEEKSTSIGYPKFDIFNAIKAEEFSIFPKNKPIVLYNPHYKKSQTSYYKWKNFIIESFENQNYYDLVISPHVKMFHEGYFVNEFLLKRRNSENVYIDTGSINSVNMTYTSNSSIYVGDVSSQVYEFIIEPRPCVFLNPHKIKWQGNPYFKHWEFGEVVENRNDIMPAIRRAKEQHYLYLDAQKEMIRKTFGTMPLLGASQRAATAIIDYLNQINMA